MKGKRIIAILLTVMMLLGVMPAVTTQAEAETTLGFAVQPKSVEVPLNGTAILSWEFDFDPADYPGMYLMLTRFLMVEPGPDQPGVVSTPILPNFCDPDGNRVKLKRKMSIAVDERYANDGYCEIEIRWMEGERPRYAWSKPFSITKELGFVIQPQTVMLSEGDEYGILQWRTNFVPDQVNLVTFFGKYLELDVCENFTDENGEPAVCSEYMSVRVPAELVWKDPYRLHVWKDGSLKASSDQFFFTDAEAILGIDSEPEAVTLSDKNCVKLSWSFNFDPEYYPEVRPYFDIYRGSEKTQSIYLDDEVFTDEAGGPVTLKRDMSILVPREMADETLKWYIRIPEDKENGRWLYAGCNAFFVPWCPDGAYDFVRQPASVVIPAGKEYAALSWVVDFYPHNDETFFITGGVYGDELKSVYKTLKDDLGGPADNRRDMAVLVTGDMVSAASYKIAWKDSIGEYHYSQPFYILDESMFRFEEQPQSDTLDRAHGKYYGSISWSVPFVPEDNDVFWIVGGEIGNAPVKVYDTFPDGAGNAAVNKQNMTIHIPDSHTSLNPYRIAIKDPFGNFCYSDPFYVKTIEDAPYFIEPPQSVIVVDGEGTLHWSINFTPNSSSYLLTYPQRGKENTIVTALLEMAVQMITKQYDATITNKSEMSLTVDDRWVSDRPYYLLLRRPGTEERAPSAPIYIRKGYNVSFVGNEYTEEIPVQAVAEGQCAAVPAIPDKIAGYTFGGWYKDKGLTQRYDFSQPVTGSLTLYAKWMRDIYTVAFYTMGGTPIPAPQHVPGGEQAAKPADPSKVGYSFTGWYTDPLLTYTYDFSKPVMEETRLYAGWKPQVFAVRFFSEVGSAPAVQKVEYGKQAADPGPMSVDGYIFEGWYSDGVEHDFTMPVKSNMMVTAKWTKICTLSFRADGGTGSMAPVTINQRESYTVPECGFDAPAGMRFVYWSLGGSYVFPGRTITISDDTVFTAVWQPIAYRTVTFDMNGHGSQIDAQQIELNGTASRPADPAAEGYTFTGWYISRYSAKIGLAADDYYRFDFGAPVTDNVTVYAGWRDDTVYKIDLQYGGEGFGSFKLQVNGSPYPEGTDVFYAHPGDVITITDIVPAKGCTFDQYDSYAVTVSNGPNYNKPIGGTGRFTMAAGEATIKVSFGLVIDPAAEGYHVHDSTTEYIHVPAQGGDCTHDGWLEHYICPVCGKWFRYNDFYKRYDGIADHSLFYFKATGHRPGEPVRKILVEPTCETEGSCVDYYYCQNENCDLAPNEYCERRTYVLPATGHDWTEPDYFVSGSWDDELWLFGYRVCRNDYNHYEFEEVQVEIETYREADCTCDEILFYYYEFENRAFGYDFGLVWGDPPLGHDWDEGTVTKEATCSEPGEIVYTCRRCGETKSETLHADHEIDYNYTWSADYSCITAHHTCPIDGWWCEYTIGTDYSVSKPATCDENGVGVYKARGYYQGLTERTKTVEIPAIGHEWGAPSYEWSDDNTTVKAACVCGHDASHVLEEWAETTYQVTREPTVSREGEGTYTATFANHLFAAQTRTVTIPKTDQFAVTVKSTAGGSASASVTSAAAGTTVKITATPNAGYALDKITWTPEGGTAMDITSAKTFVMPAKKVTVNVSFKTLQPSVGGSVSGGKLTYTTANVPAGARLIAARYDGGRLTDVQIVASCKASDTLTMRGSGAKYRLFLIDGSTSSPLCPGWSN